MQLDSHFYAALLACQAAFELTEALPETDLIEEIYSILVTQHELFMCLVQGTHFGSDRLIEFVKHCETMKIQAERLKEVLP